MRVRVSRTWLSLTACLTGSCALTGYDFGDYEPAPVNGDQRPGAGGETLDDESLGGRRLRGRSETGGAAGEPAGDGAVELVSSAFGVGGAVAANAGAGAGQNTGRPCQPRSCFEQGLLCGPALDTCGQPLDCGVCFWWFQECHQNRCEIPE